MNTLNVPNCFQNLLYMDPSVLTVYQCPYPKLRIGKDYDGGYIIADIPDIKYQIILAGGIAEDISFEEAFIEKYHSKCIAFDGTIRELPIENNTIEFVRKNINYYNNEQTTNLHDIIDEYENIFIKMDIEGGEIPWIKSLSDEQMNKFNQIVMEFHFPFSNNEIDVFDAINKNHILVHFHGNNCCGTRIHKGVQMPNVFECTYLHKKFFVNPPLLNTDLIPGKLDMQNTSNPEICIDYPPFVNAIIETPPFGMKVFIIHYKKLVERKIHILDQLRKYNIFNFEFVEIDRDELEKHNTSMFTNNYNNALKAIFLSHYHAYKEISAKYDNALILEDDVILSHNFINKLNSYLSQLPENYDMLYIGDGCNSHIEASKLIPNNNIYVREDRISRCTDSYIINKKSAVQLCDYICKQKGTVDVAIDWWLNTASNDNNFNIYWAEPTIATQGTLVGLFKRSYV